MDLSFLTSPGEGHAASLQTVCGKAEVCGFGIRSSKFEYGLCWLVAVTCGMLFCQLVPLGGVVVRGFSEQRMPRK